MKIIIDGIIRRPDEPEESLKETVESIYNTRCSTFSILKRSLDARKKSNIHFKYRIAADVPQEDVSRLLQLSNIAEEEPSPLPDIEVTLTGKKYIIVGSGPGGLFAALRLIARGAVVVILERGKDVTSRMKDIHNLETLSQLNGESNVVFGEGGAGTYSDGKLTTGTNRKETAWVYTMLKNLGIDRSILADSKPHIGTDRLQGFLISVRNHIEKNNSSIHFNKKVDTIISYDGKATGVRTVDGDEFTGNGVLLATGHSARDLYYMLHEKGIALEKKAFAVGLRVEHSSQHINTIQYGSLPIAEYLPTAEYKLTWNNSSTKRGVYSFCMCPGGSVINSSSEDEMLCINGMSNSARNNRWSNAALVVTVRPEDTGNDIFSGITFQRELERGAYREGLFYNAPAQKLTSFLQNKEDISLPPSSYLPGVVPGNLRNILPQFITDELLKGIYSFEKKMKGFITEDALLIGTETRTSSPIRIMRNREYQSISLPALYPIGEGAGYAGGIISSAVDGVRCADAVV